MIAIEDGAEPDFECVRRAAERREVGPEHITELLVAAYERGDSEEKMAADILSSWRCAYFVGVPLTLSIGQRLRIKE